MSATAGAIVIVLSWLLNAVADAIDHGKGDRTLYELWHIVKALSYGLPFGYIVIIKQLSLWMILCTAIAMYSWQPIYEICRDRNLQELDDKIKIPWLAWLWKIKR